MSMAPITGEQMLSAIDAMRRSLETLDHFDPDDDLLIAAKFNVRRKARMINAMRRYYAYQRGNGPKPEMMPSQAFDPTFGPEKTNIYYFFKELKKKLPWELDHNLLVEPIAYTLIMLDIANRLYPCPIVSKGMITFKDLVNLLTIRAFNVEETEEANQRKREGYFKRIEMLETDMRQFYTDMSNHFAEIENPEKNPVTREIHETHETTKKVAHRLKVDAAEKRSSSVAQKRALEMWEKNRRNPAACMSGRKTSYASVFDLCKGVLAPLGIDSAQAFEKAVRAALKNDRRRKKGQKRVSSPLFPLRAEFDSTR